MSLLGPNRPARNPAAPDPGASAENRPPAAAPLPGWMQERTRVAVGRDITVSGKLIFNEPVRIEGHFRGEVNSVGLVVITDEATVEGRVQAGRLVVLGELRGDIEDSGQVYIGPGARVTGNVSAKNLTVCEGAWLQGKIRMTGLK